MANQTFSEIASLVLLHCPSAPQTLARSWVQSAFRDIVERRRWSWLLKRGQLVTYDVYNTGTATAVVGTNTVTITTGVVAADHVGRQFRFTTTLPVVTITAIDAALNTYTIDQSQWPSTQTAKTYEVYQAYVAVPSDFHSFVSVTDPVYAQPVPTDASVTQFDQVDPERVAAGSPPSALGWFDYYNALPRFELWPHQKTAAVYPTTYESRPADPFDAGAAVPALLPADIILERAMMYCAMWPGTQNEPNPYFGPKLGLAQLHKAEFERRIATIEKQDTEHMQQSIWYQSEQVGQSSSVSGAYMQSHDLA